MWWGENMKEDSQSSGRGLIIVSVILPLILLLLISIFF